MAPKGFRTANRPKSKNIEDRRNKSWEINTFVNESLKLGSTNHKTTARFQKARGR